MTHTGIDFHEFNTETPVDNLYEIFPEDEPSLHLDYTNLRKDWDTKIMTWYKTEILLISLEKEP